MHKLLAAAVLAALSLNVSAALVDNHTFTTDTVSGLDWLDVTATSGLTVASVELLIATGGALEDWRYATAIEADSLFTSFSFPDDGVYTAADSEFDAVTVSLGSFVSLLGNTASSDSVYGNKGRIDNGRGGFATIHAFHVFDGDQVSIKRKSTKGIAVKGGSPVTGSYLVRMTTVPVPAAVWLFGSGLGLLGWMRRKATV